MLAAWKMTLIPVAKTGPAPTQRVAAPRATAAMRPRIAVKGVFPTAMLRRNAANTRQHRGKHARSMLVAVSTGSAGRRKYVLLFYWPQNIYSCG